MLVTADVVELYPSIPHNEGVEVLKKQIDNFYEKSIPTEDLAKMAEYVLKLTILSFWTAIGMKFEIHSWIWLRYIDDIFSFEQLVKKNLMIFWNNSSIFILI